MSGEGKLFEVIQRLGLDSHNPRMIPAHYAKELRDATLSAPDDELLSCSSTLEAYMAMAGSLRLKDALHAKEVATKELTRNLVVLTRKLVFLTWALLGFTVVLVLLGGIAVVPVIRDLLR